MAHIIFRPNPDDRGAMQLFVNGIDFSNEVFHDVEIVSVGDGENPLYDEVGVRVTFALSRLDLGGDHDVEVTDRLPEVAQRVRTMIEATA